MKKENKNIFCNVLAQYTKSLSLTQAQIATMINKELNLSPEDSGFISQSTINKIQRGSVIVNYKVSNFLSKKLLFVDIDKINSAIELAIYIYDNIDKSRIKIEEIFSLKTTPELYFYIYKNSTSQDTTDIKCSEVKSKLKIIEDYLNKLPHEIYVESINNNSDGNINSFPEINSSGLIVLYFAFLYLSDFSLQTKEINNKLKEIISYVDSGETDAIEFIYKFTDVYITKEMSLSVKSKLIKSFIKKIKFYENYLNAFKDFFEFSEKQKQYLSFFSENIPELSTLANTADSIQNIQTKNDEDFVRDNILENIDLIWETINWPLNVLFMTYDFYIHKEKKLITIPNKDYINNKYDYIKNFILKNGDFSIINIENILKKIEEQYHTIISNYVEIESLTIDKYKEIIDIQKDFVDLCNYIESLIKGLK